jgi:hypothetical protein
MHTSYKLLLTGLFIWTGSMAQSTPDSVKKAPNNWFQLDKNETGFNGISLDKAYDFIKSKKA